MKRFLVIYIDEATDRTIYKDTYGESRQEVYERYDKRLDVYHVVDVIDDEPV